MKEENMTFSRKILLELPPTESNPRNSEGDFARLPDGSILFAYTRFSGDSWNDHADSEICAVYARDGERFEKESMKTLVHPERFGGSNAMSVTLRPWKNGGVSLYFLVKYDTEGTEKEPLRDEIYRIDSSDGYDFSGDAVLCFPQDRRGYYVVNNCRVETLSTGRIIVPVSTTENFREPWSSFFLYSDDGGKTFRKNAQTLVFPDRSSKSGLQEPGVVELADGRLYAYFRTDAGYQYESFSSDSGITWTEPRPSRFGSPLSPMLIRKNPHNGKYYAIWNPYGDNPENVGRPCFPNTWGRTPLAFSESPDGVRFGETRFIEEDLRFGYCYPSVFFLSEHEALVSYCSGGIDIATLQKTTISKITF